MEESSSEDEEGATLPCQSYAAAARSNASEAIPVSSKKKTGGKGVAGHKRKPSCTVPATPPVNECVSGTSSGTLPMVGDLCTADVSENYTDDEKALNTFQKLHPLLSLESTTQKALQLVANLLDTTELPTVEMPCIPKSYDDQFLGPPNTLAGERPCCLGGKCIAYWMAVFRYGEGNDKGFVCKEFLLPEQKKWFESSGNLPPQPAKCLLCTCALPRGSFATHAACAWCAWWCWCGDGPRRASTLGVPSRLARGTGGTTRRINTEW